MISDRKFKGMHQVSIDKFKMLIELAKREGIEKIDIVKGRDISQGDQSLFYWGVACSISVPNNQMSKLLDLADKHGFMIIGQNSFAYTNGRTIHDFRAGRVDENLNLKE